MSSPDTPCPALQTRRSIAVLGLLLLIVSASRGAVAQRLSVSRDNATILVEPYSPNVVRVSLSLRRDDALAAPGYGISARPDGNGWSIEQNQTGDILRSS